MVIKLLQGKPEQVPDWIKQTMVSYEMQISWDTCDFWIWKETGESSQVSLKLLLRHLPKQNNVTYENLNQSNRTSHQK